MFTLLERNLIDSIFMSGEVDDNDDNDDALIDSDLINECNEGLIPAFDDEDGDDFDTELFAEVENDVQRRLYLEDTFEGNSATKWKHSKEHATRIEVNGAEKDLLAGIKSAIAPTLAICERVCGGKIPDLHAADFLLLYLNRDWYLMIQDYINFRIDEAGQRPTIQEIFEMQRVWLLQSIYQVTAKALYENTDWYAPIKKIKITYDRYSFLLNKLGNDLPLVSVVNRGSEARDDETAQKVWGSFNDYNEIVGKLERHIGGVGQKFIFEKVTDLTIDDDKLRHQSSTFKKAGLQQTGFRGSRCGPVMNCAGTVQSNLIVSIYFSRKGDGVLSTVTNLMRNLGYGSETILRSRLDATILLDRGYNIPSVIQFFLRLRSSLLGTHSEKAGNWCFCTGGDAKSHQKVVPIEGARAVFFASRKVNNVSSFAMCYRNGSKGIGNIHSTLPLTGVWDLVNKKGSVNPPQPPPLRFLSLPSERLYKRWQGTATIFVSCQGCTPWFEARMGHLTGTTVLRTLKAVKFVIVDTVKSPQLSHFLRSTIGLKLVRKTQQQLAGVSLPVLKKAYRALGHMPTSKTPRQDMITAVTRQHPSDMLVFQKIVTSWCMTPIKKKNRDIVEAFRQGKVAEPLIHDNVAEFIRIHTKGMILVSQGFNVGLVKSRDDKISAVSPDALAVLECATSLTPGVSEYGQIALDSDKLVAFLDMVVYADGAAELIRHDDGVTMYTLACMEYKHKSEASTIQESRNIISTVLDNCRVRVLTLGEDDDLFHKAVPNVDYRCQVIHEAVVTDLPVAVFAVASTTIDFALIILIPPSVAEMYREITKFVKLRYLTWLFTEESDLADFDTTLDRMPIYSTTEVAYSYAKDAETVRCRLVIMMCLWKLRMEIGRPLLPADALIPKYVSAWNIQKGPIDDMSHVLSTCLPSFGAIPGICWVWIRVFSVALYCAWRLHATKESRDAILSNECDSRKKLSNYRQYYGGSFREYLKEIYLKMRAPVIAIAANKADAAKKGEQPLLKRPLEKKVMYSDWATKEEWISFRRNGCGHVPAKIIDCMKMGLVGHRAKKKRTEVKKKRKTGQKEPGRSEKGEEKKYIDVRKWCLYCTKVVVVNYDDGGMAFDKEARFQGRQFRRTTKMCSACLVPLCHGKSDCFFKWHTEDLPAEVDNGQGEEDEPEDGANDEKEDDTADPEEDINDDEEEESNDDDEDYVDEEEESDDDNEDFNEERNNGLTGKEDEVMDEEESVAQVEQM